MPRRRLLSFAVVVALFGCRRDDPDPGRARREPPIQAVPAPVPAAAERFVFPEHFGKPEMMDFAKAMTALRIRYVSAQSVVDKADATRELAALQEKYLAKGVTDWIAQLVNIQAAADGSSVGLSMLARLWMSDGFTLDVGFETSDASSTAALFEDETLVRPASPLWETLRSLRPGDYVRFSASFQRAAIDRVLVNYGDLGAADSTLGEMTRPRYWIRLKSLARAQAESRDASSPSASASTKGAPSILRIEDLPRAK